MKQVLLTPFTVALDATVVGFIIAVAAAHHEVERDYSLSPDYRK